MATFIEIVKLDETAIVEFTYDDTEMKLIELKLSNNSKLYLDIFFISPLIFSKRINPGEVFKRTLTSIEKPSYNIRNTVKPYGVEQVVDGITWRCSLGV